MLGLTHTSDAFSNVNWTKNVHVDVAFADREKLSDCSSIIGAPPEDLSEDLSVVATSEEARKIFWSCEPPPGC